MKFFAIRIGHALHPLDSTGLSAVDAIKDGQQVMVELKKPRNVNRHRLYWALVNKVFELQSRYATTDTLHAVFKCAAGLAVPVTMPDGRAALVPLSTSFEKMSEDGFRQYLDRVMDLIATDILPHVNTGDLKREVSQMCGVGDWS